MKCCDFSIARCLTSASRRIAECPFMVGSNWQILCSNLDLAFLEEVSSNCCVFRS